MKIRLLACLVLLPALLPAGEPALPDFSSKSIGLPPLSLADLSRGTVTLGLPFSGAAPTRPGPPTAARAPSRHVNRASGMPILEPDPAVDYKLVVKAPDPSVDHKLIIRDPTPAAAR